MNATLQRGEGVRTAMRGEGVIAALRGPGEGVNAVKREAS